MSIWLSSDWLIWQKSTWPWEGHLKQIEGSSSQQATGLGGGVRYAFLPTILEKEVLKDLHKVPQIIISALRSN